MGAQAFIAHADQMGSSFRLIKLVYSLDGEPSIADQLASADAFFGHFLDAWTRNPDAMPADVRAEYLRASRDAVPSIVADYRASAGIDLAHVPLGEALTRACRQRER